MKYRDGALISFNEQKSANVLFRKQTQAFEYFNREFLFIDVWWKRQRSRIFMNFWDAISHQRFVFYLILFVHIFRQNKYRRNIALEFWLSTRINNRTKAMKSSKYFKEPKKSWLIHQNANIMIRIYQSALQSRWMNGWTAENAWSRFVFQIFSTMSQSLTGFTRIVEAVLDSYLSIRSAPCAAQISNWPNNRCSRAKVSCRGC